MCFRFLQVTWNFLKTGELPHHDHGHVDGLEDEVAAVDANPYSLDDNLHVHDLKHKPLGDREGDRK
jgi:C4-dicarboxylate transporter DctQ subunit